jgi:ABC-type glycerol-3-phosphate transport system substrate-binding protein
MRALLIAAALALLPAAAAAQEPVCARAELLRQALSGEYGEMLVATAAASGGTTVEWWAASKGARTWTMLVIGPDGRACVAAMGGLFAFAGRGA